jgi:thymidine kinase
MPKLHYRYSTMNAGKSTELLQADHNYRSRGMRTLLLTAAIDTRAGSGVIESRIGLSRPAETFADGDDLFLRIASRTATQSFDCILVDEAQFLSEDQVWQLARVVDRLGIPVMCYGIRTDFQGNLFPGSSRLLAIADDIKEIRTVCRCGARATMVVRTGSDGRAIVDGDQISIGGDEAYVTFCRRHWEEETGRVLVSPDETGSTGVGRPLPTFGSDN